MFGNKIEYNEKLNELHERIKKLEHDRDIEVPEELERAMTMLLEKSLEIGRILRKLGNKDYMSWQIQVEQKSECFNIKQGSINIHVYGDTIRNIVRGTNSTTFDMDRLNYKLQKKLNVSCKDDMNFVDYRTRD